MFLRETNPMITKFMKDNSIETYSKLEEFYVQKLVNIVDDLKANSVVWEEVFTNGVILPKQTVVHVWIDGENRKSLMSNVSNNTIKVTPIKIYFFCR